MRPKIYILSTLIFLSINTFGQHGLYFISNYTPKDYFSEVFTTSPQNWSFVQNQNGDILVGNTSAVFFIENEKIIPISGTFNQRFLTFAKSSSGVIHCGGSNDLGYFGFDSVSNQVQFKSLISYLPPEFSDFDPIKNTIAVGDRIYFMSEKYLLEWNGKGFNTWITSSKFLAAFILDAVLHIQQENLGVFSLMKDSLTLVIQPEIISNLEIIAGTYNHDILEADKSMLLITKRNGLFTYDSVDLQPVDIHGLQRSMIIRDVIELTDGNLALATDRQGVIIFDRKARLRNIINTGSGLYNNTINGVYQSNQGGIWIGMNKGFAHLEYPISTSYFNEANGLEGIVYKIIGNENRLLVATNAGLYEHSGIELKFEKGYSEIEEPWDLLKLDKDVMVAATSGVFIISKGISRKICDEDARTIHRLKSNTELFLVGLKNGLGILQFSNGEWIWKGKMNGIEHEVQRIVEDNTGEFWVGYDEISLLSFENGTFSEPQLKTFTGKEGFLDDLGIFEATFVNGRVLFGTDGGIFSFNKDANKLQPDTTYGKQFSDGSRYVFAMKEDQLGNIWFTSNGQNGKITKLQNGTYLWDSLSLCRIPRTDTWAIHPDDQGIIWLGTTDGLYRYDPGVEKDYNLPYNTLIRNAKLQGDSSIFSGAFLGKDGFAISIQPEAYIYSFPHENRDIAFEYSATSYDYPEKLQYSYMLEGYDQDWSLWTSETKKEYTSLWERDYTFRVKSKNVYGTIGNEATYQFSVLPPFYRTWWAYTLGAVALIGFVFTYTRYRVNKHKKALAKERLLIEKLKHTDQLKDTFLANTSHELRTPLTGIIGIAESLKDGVAGEPTEKMKTNLSMLVASGKRLSSLVNSILDFSKLKTHDLQLQKRAVDLRSIVSVVLKMSEPLISGKDLTLKNNILEDIPAVLADEDRLQQIFHNLIGNAIKFTEQGAVTVSAKHEKNLIRISVIDTGIGIPEDKIDFIFKEFEQVDASTTRQFVGTGLGLSITKQLVELHGGTIEVHSQMGEGSTFIFTLPVTSQPAMPSSSTLEVAKVQSDQDGKQAPTLIGDEQYGSGTIKVLVVDDEPVNQTVLSNFLSSDLFAITPALNGAEALSVLAKQKFDLVLLDIMMPKMSGFEVCQKIREKYLPSELPVIMITAKNQVSDLVEGLSTGANDYITKPFSRDEFLARVKTHLNLFKINTAYGRFVPHEFLKALGRESIIDVRLGDQVQGEVTVFFSDIRSYSSLSELMTPEQNFNFLNAYLHRVGPIIKKHNGFVNQFLGDGIMALFRHSAEDALKASIAIQREVAEL